MNKLHEAIETFSQEFEKQLEGYSYVILKKYDFERIFVIEDVYIVLVSYTENDSSYLSVCEDSCQNFNEKFDINMTGKSDDEYVFRIAELTDNQIRLRYNKKKLIQLVKSKLNVKDVWVIFEKFKGYGRRYWNCDEETLLERVDRTYPELLLLKRYDAWPGKRYYFIIFDFTGIDGNVHHVVAYTMTSPISYVNKLAQHYIETGVFCIDTVRRGYCWDFENAIKSWRGMQRQKRLDNYLSYCVFESQIKEYDDCWKYADTLLSNANKGLYDNIEKTSYTKPNNKWKSEEYTYNLTKKIYKNHKVIYQHRPFFLKSSIGGQMSYDIFISGMNVAIEYQGKQHFEAVDFFGGVESFRDVKRRDLEKAELSKVHGIKLVYINYWEDVTPELIRSRVEK